MLCSWWLRIRSAGRNQDVQHGLTGEDRDFRTSRSGISGGSEIRIFKSIGYATTYDCSLEVRVTTSTDAEPIRDCVSVHLTACSGGANPPRSPGTSRRSHADSWQPDIAVFPRFFDCGTFSGTKNFKFRISILLSVL